MQRYQPPHMRSRPGAPGVGSGGGSNPRSSPTPSASATTPTSTLNGSRVVTMAPTIAPSRPPPSGLRPSQRDWSGFPSSTSRPSPSSSSTPAGPPRAQPSSSSWPPVPRPTRSPAPPGQQGGYTLASPASDLRPSRRVFDTNPLGEMEMMQSVSRSGGEGGEGDALKDWKTQERFRLYIEERIEKHRRAFNLSADRCAPVDAAEELESVQSLVLLFRKLREGVVASGRIDPFAIQVFEDSARYAVFARNHAQLRSSLSGLIPGLYIAVDEVGNKHDQSNGPNESQSDSVADLTSGLAKLDVGEQGTSSTSAGRDKRAEFTTLHLLQMLVQDRTMFHTTFMDLTTPPRRPMIGAGVELRNGNGNGDGASAGAGDPTSASTLKILGTHEGRAFIKPSEIPLVILANKALAPETFDPLLYFQLCRGVQDQGHESGDIESGISSSPGSPRLVGTAASVAREPHIRGVLSWAEGDVRDRAWAVVRRAYLEADLEWVGRMLGLPQRRGGGEGVGVGQIGTVEEWVEGKGAKVVDGRVKLR